MPHYYVCKLCGWLWEWRQVERCPNCKQWSRVIYDDLDAAKDASEEIVTLIRGFHG